MQCSDDLYLSIKDEIEIKEEVEDLNTKEEEWIARRADKRSLSTNLCPEVAPKTKKLRPDRNENHQDKTLHSPEELNMAALHKLHHYRQRQRRSFHDRKDILSDLDDRELVKRYRLDRAGILHVTDLVREKLTRPTSRNNALSPEMQILITLQYLATGKIQQCSADDLGPSQQTISRVISDTVDVLSDNAILSQFIRFPVTPVETQRRKGEFMQIAGFPEVIGVITGTHVRIVAPKEYAADYVNRKRYHSINVQVVFDANYRIIDVVAKWPGSVHDARILSESGLSRIYDTGIVPAGCHLLGDTGYPSKKWLLTPYLRPQPGPQSSYNRAHKNTHSVVKRGIGQLKQRFRVLHSEIRVSPPSKVCRIIEVCAMLHNICKTRNIVLLEDNHPVGEDGDEERQPPIQEPQHRREGLLYRDDFAVLHFNNDE